MPAVAQVGLLGVEQIALPLRLVGVGHHQVVDPGFGVAGQPGAGVGQLDADGNAQLAEDGADHVHVQTMGNALRIQKLQRRLQGATDDQLFGLQPEGEQQAEQNESSQTTSPARNRESLAGIIQVYWPLPATEATADGKP